MMKKVIMAVVFSLGLSFTANAQQAQSEQLVHDPYYAMRKSLNPVVYLNLFKLMMDDPTIMMTYPIATCAQCHSGEDMARYEKTMGPMMEMMNPVNWTNPNIYHQMMTTPMDPETYTEWYNAYMKKFGGMMNPPQTETQ